MVRGFAVVTRQRFKTRLRLPADLPGCAVTHATCLAVWTGLHGLPYRLLRSTVITVLPRYRYYSSRLLHLVSRSCVYRWWTLHTTGCPVLGYARFAGLARLPFHTRYGLLRAYGYDCSAALPDLTCGLTVNGLF